MLFYFCFVNSCYRNEKSADKEMQELIAENDYIKFVIQLTEQDITTKEYDIAHVENKVASVTEQIADLHKNEKIDLLNGMQLIKYNAREKHDKLYTKRTRMSRRKAGYCRAIQKMHEKKDKLQQIVDANECKMQNMQNKLQNVACDTKAKEVRKLTTTKVNITKAKKSDVMQVKVALPCDKGKETSYKIRSIQMDVPIETEKEQK